MTKVRQRASLPVDAVKLALERERQKREDIKPIELLKVALSAYLAFTFNEDDAKATGGKTPRESTDRAALRRGTQAAVDRLLFNANYWRAAYESRVFDACEQPEDAQLCLQALSVWTSAHPQVEHAVARRGRGHLRTLLPALRLEPTAGIPRPGSRGEGSSSRFQARHRPDRRKRQRARCFP